MASKWCYLETEWNIRIISLHRCMGLSVYNFLYSSPLSQPCFLDMLSSFLQRSPSLPPCCMVKALGLSRQSFYTIAAFAITSSSQCLYHLLGIYHTPPCIVAYLFTGIFCLPHQEDCKHSHTKVLNRYQLMTQLKKSKKCCINRFWPFLRRKDSYLHFMEMKINI